ncbi:ABC transporter permease [Mesorhizobium sp. M7D.F.Ca.US.005.01.1.1]|jgi:ABC-type dipeptide/oligopeptide/nickel transport system permease component|uniref:Peptide/nickel transport system permease protein n=1 Tax=Rhizobium loti TaxID=381 RepID=A0A8E3B5T1_RHILI|nr:MULTISPECIES: ABC transporter permease [Mesorhizobium]AZO41916.1 ABC transporter permease [Mesorhizobium sp. M7D.F.Ca.US.005.01.1.1]PWJ92270.1 peptide/nickel transport system permease protein [Mesorhizobium loti]
MIIKYTLQRLLMLIPVSLSISVVIFLVVHLLPGDPIDNLMRVGSSPEDRLAMTVKYGLDRTLVEQYLLWIRSILSGDFGEAIVLRRPVSALIWQNLPYSLTLGALAFAFSSIVGMIAGTVSAVAKNPVVEQVVKAFILLGSTVPSFWLALLMILLFSVTLGWFPVSGAKTWTALVLPVLTIGFGGIALVARVTRVALVEIARQDFVTLLHAKGLSRSTILFRHLLPHAFLPVVTILALRIGWILGGAVTVEFVFGRPGLGSLLIRALGQRDYPVVQGCLLMLALAVMLGTLIGDVAQAALDPRVREATT